MNPYSQVTFFFVCVLFTLNCFNGERNARNEKDKYINSIPPNKNNHTDMRRKEETRWVFPVSLSSDSSLFELKNATCSETVRIGHPYKLIIFVTRALTFTEEN